jgi:hypothetical protein
MQIKILAEPTPSPSANIIASLFVSRFAAKYLGKYDRVEFFVHVPRVCPAVVLPAIGRFVHGQSTFLIYGRKRMIIDPNRSDIGNTCFCAKSKNLELV